MNPGILTPPTQFATMPRGLLGRPTPVLMPDDLRITDPRAVRNCVAWWDAADEGTISLNGKNVSRWLDKSGFGNNLTQGTALNQPPYSRGAVNGLNAVTFGGTATAHRLTNASLNVAAPTVFAVWRVSAAYVLFGSNAPIVFDTFTPGPSASRFVTTFIENSTTISFGRAGGIPATQSTFAGGVYGQLYVTTSVARDIGHRLFVNGAAGSIATAGTNGLIGISVGNLRGNPSPIVNQYAMDGPICEVIVYSQTPSDRERVAIERYLGTKWGVVMR